MSTLLAVLSGETLLHTFLWVVVIGFVAWLLWWLVDFFKLPEPFNKAARCIIALAAVLFLINALLTLVDKPFIKW